MAVSSRPDHFFQTSISIEENERRQRKASNTFGSPVKFPTKLLSIQVDPAIDPSGDWIFVTEAGGTVSYIRLSSNEITKIGRNLQTPVTCIAGYGSAGSTEESKVTQAIYAGGWDKSITRFVLRKNPPSNLTVSEQSTFKAHSDFVKCLLIAHTPENEAVLISGAADGDIHVWTLMGEKLTTIRPQCRGIECLALDPFSPPTSPSIFFSTSQREIFSFVLPSIQSMRSTSIKLSEPILQHETSVYKLTFDNEGDIWTASADKTSKRLVRDNNFAADTTLLHPDFVRDVVVLDLQALVVTACRDEEIRVWNSGTTEILHIFTGHFEEVTGLALVGNILLSVSIDATLRRWSLDPQDLRKEIEKAKNPNLLEEEPEPQSDLTMLTAEEEAELRALMETEEEDTLEKMAMDEQ